MESFLDTEERQTLNDRLGPFEIDGRGSKAKKLGECELNRRNVERRFCTNELLLQHSEGKFFLSNNH